ncbi:hypothetical protein OIO90_006086 [Microbotryomycetes sp. JL221]|nr:hypothetical protein OIO90_006086 [Microbotryomycetes sp. JL221]
MCDFGGRDRRRQTLSDLRDKVDKYEAILARLKTCSDQELAAILSRDTVSTLDAGSDTLKDRSTDQDLELLGGIMDRQVELVLIATQRRADTGLDRRLALDAEGNIKAYGSLSNQLLSTASDKNEDQAMLAVTCHMCDWPIAREDPNSAETAGNQFFRTAKALLDEELDADRPAISTIQALALMAKREVFCGRGQRAGLYFAMCARLVLDLGLHLDVSALVPLGKVTIEQAYVRSQCFWGIWSLDKEFTALLGRPCMLRDIVITCPMPAHWHADDFNWAASVASATLRADQHNQSDTMHIAASTIDMSRLFLKSMEQIYWNVSRRSFDDMLTDLESLMASTNEAINCLPSVTPDTAVTPPVVSLHIFYQSHIIMACRPLLVVHSDGRSELLDNRKRCVDAAREIVRLTGVFKQSSRFGLVKTINAHQHCLVLAGSVFLYELLTSEPSLVGLDREMARFGLDQVLSFLDELSTLRPVAKQAATNLRSVLQQRVPSTIQSDHDFQLSLSLSSQIPDNCAQMWIDSLEFLPSMTTPLSLSGSGTNTPTTLQHVDTAFLFDNLFGNVNGHAFNSIG